MQHQATDMLTQFSNQLADAVERVGSTLVQVNGRQRLPASGVIYAHGLVLTADHVLEREEDLTIRTDDGRVLPAQFVGRDTASDLAVLRVADLNRDPASVATAQPRVGQFVLAVGRPSEHSAMASQGIISTVGGPLRTRRGATIEQYIQTDATPYPGFSGGPLIDGQGAVVGITTTGLVQGATLAVPTQIAWRIADTLAQQGHIKRGFLGIGSQPVYLPEGQRAGLTQESGLLVVRVEADSPATQGGMLVGDIVVQFNQQTITDTDELQAQLAGSLVGQSVPVQVLRGGSLHTIQITVGERGQRR